MRGRSALLALTLGSALAAGAAAQAATQVLTVNGGWQTFSYGDAWAPWSNSYTFTLAAPAILKVTDGYLSGERYEVHLWGTVLLNADTGTPTAIGAQAGADFDLAFSDPRWSHWSISLPAGTYELAGDVFVSPYDGGTGAVELVSRRQIGGFSALAAAAPAPAPEPAAWALMIAGFGLAGSALRRRYLPGDSRRISLGVSSVTT